MMVKCKKADVCDNEGCEHIKDHEYWRGCQGYCRNGGTCEPANNDAICPSCQEKDKRIAELEKMHSDTKTKALLFIEALEKVLGEKVKSKDFQSKLVEALLRAGVK